MRQQQLNTRWSRYSAYYQLSLSPPRMRKSKSPGLFIHPNHSNIARADAVAVELGLREERLRSPRTSSDSDDRVGVGSRPRPRDCACSLRRFAARMHEPTPTFEIRLWAEVVPSRRERQRKWRLSLSSSLYWHTQIPYFVLFIQSAGHCHIQICLHV
jgi:hypothetical protein